jgi:hypothetical protein
MRLGRSRLLATLVAIASLWLTVAYVRRRRRETRERLANYIAHSRLDLVEVRDPPEPSFIELASLEEARTMDHTAAIMQGGGGEQIYLTVPIKYVRCEEAALGALLKVLDALACKDAARASLTFELAPIGSGLYAGMGGGAIVDGIWLHPQLEQTGIRDTVTAVIAGSRPVDTTT